MIINVSIEVFAVTSMFLQIIINEMQGTGKEKTMIQRLTQQKRKRSGKISIEIISYSNMSLQSIVNDHRRRSKETSIFWRLGQKQTFVIINILIGIFAVTSMFLKRNINKSSVNQQWKINDSEVNTTKTKTIRKVSHEIVNVSTMSLQSIINEPSSKR